ncbi:TonB-dependent receptor [Massilia solisilvae]|uniref:TonB-dependent receptor n=1 Tax=Massilia solisilvae TaxID=1811225 RepID=A0ABT2BHT4_9BURK|nr:TonB-dependent receptor [Massilia solisilvae]MCS0608076.1 TonB-dependent receptor [Massilia solisilvae]
MLKSTNTSALCAASRKLLLGALVGDVLCSGWALAQQAPVAKPVVQQPVQADTANANNGEVPAVTVSAQRPASRIDRQVYDVKSDASSTNGTAADALNNVPSVSLDPDGTLTLRGSSNVQIYIDGKPSAMFQGENRAAALQALPSEDIESIEVINNPGAQFGNETGGGPILNIVMKRTRKPGGFGVVNANGGTAGRYNSAVSGTYNSGRIGLQGGINVRHDGRNLVGQVERERVNVATGEVTRSAQASSSAGLNESAGLNGSIKYNLGDTDTLSAAVSWLGRTNDANAVDRYLGFGLDGVTVSDYQRTTARGGDSSNYTVSTHWDRKGELPGEIFKLDLRVSSARNASDSDYANAYSVRPPGTRDSRSQQVNDNTTRITDFSGDYERPGDKGVLKLGFKAIAQKSGVDALYEDIDVVTGAGVVNPRRTNSFELNQHNLAAYASYQLRLTDRLGVLGGLRAEYTHVDIDQITSNINATNHYVNAIPSAFATYKLTDDTNLRLAYARRLRRASAAELNPFVVYRDELNESAGNPSLHPALTDSLELGLESRLMGLEANLRGYYRRDKDAILYRRSFVGDAVVLTRPENGPGSRTGGLEFTLGGKVTPRFSINTSGNLAHIEQPQLDATGADVRRSATSLSMRGRFNVELTDVDHLQVALNGQGKALTGQGYRQPTSFTNVSLRHNITPALSVVMNVTDIFNTQKIETVTDTETLRETNLRRFDGRIVYLGLSWRLGGPAAVGRGAVRN